VHPPGLVRKRNGEPYNVYTPFGKAWKRLLAPQASDLLPAPTRIKTPGDLRSESFPSTPPSEWAMTWPAGEVEAQRRLHQFAHHDLAPIFDYAQARNFPGVEGTSLLSPYLRFGMVSARQAAVAAFRAVELAPTSAHRKGAETWLDELIWREFYIAVLYYFPHVRTGSFQPRYDRVAWINDPAQLRAWQEGCTGYPIVDAAMRQLKKSGWMHNRVRMIAASFLVKDLLIDWRLGEQWFMQHLIDGDPAANNGGWQWIAGTGIDAAPYFRVFNPIVQSKKFDPKGYYIRSQVPELADVPGKYVHEPWQMPPHLQQESRCLIGEDYPWPVIGHAEARERALAAYRAVSGGREAAT
jgi:deoxyribodipyrimidine photo-lyase